MSILSSLSRRIRRFTSDAEGVTAVEFALIAPFLVMLYLGSIELSLLLRADRTVTSTSASLGDLTARLKTVSDDDMQQMYAAAVAMMQPHDAASARMRLSSVEDNGDGILRVTWSEGYNMAPYAVGDVVTVPSGIVPTPGSVIVSEVAFDYTSSIGYMFSTARTLSDTFYLRPRLIDTIAHEGDGGSFGP